MNDRKKNHRSRHDVPDLRQLTLITMVLAGMAILLTAGLLPRTARDDAAAAGLDRAAALHADCQLIQRMTYTPCGHEVTRRVSLPAELAGKDRAALEAVYDLWRVTAFAADEVTMEQALAIYCPQHTILMADESGILCVWQNRYGDALALTEELGIPVSDFPEDMQDRLRAGIGFDGREALDAWLESAES